MRKVKVTTILGTRPELIRLSVIIDELDKVFDHRIIHTGQNYDFNLSEIFFKEMGIRKPDLHLNCSSHSLGKFLGESLIEIERELELNQPDAVLLLGDTNSALTGIIAKRKGIPVYHLEAGNRSFDPNVPEETNRRIVDHFSDFNLAYTEHARRNLLSEGLHPRNVIVVGSPMFEVLRKQEKQIKDSSILDKLGLTQKGFFLVSAHRQENVDSPSRLLALIDTLNTLATTFNIPVVVSTHPRTRSKIAKQQVLASPLIQFKDPFGFHDYIRLQQEARIVLSDSGSVSEEAAILGFPAITIRDSMERPEALEAGVVSLSGLTADGVLLAIEVCESIKRTGEQPEEYFIPNTSQRVVNFIASTVKVHKFWSGVRDETPNS